MNQKNAERIRLKLKRRFAALNFEAIGLGVPMY